MNVRRIVGAVLLVLGMVIFLWGGVFWTDRDKLIDAGPIQVTRQEHKGVALPPLLGVLSVLAGVVLIAVPNRTRA
jgi:drug/metabolite transporter (DMT)-like permease